MNEYKKKKSTGIILESGFSREKEEKQSEEAAFQAKGPAFANAWRKMRAWGNRWTKGADSWSSENADRGAGQTEEKRSGEVEN